LYRRSILLRVLRAALTRRDEQASRRISVQN